LSIEDRRDPLQRLGVHGTYRRLRVLAAIAELGRRGSGPSNREVADVAGIEDEGQTSRLLKRLEGLTLIENAGLGHTHGAPNSWWLTAQGEEVLRELEAWEWEH
jgi:DNA-binding MarR family transcriptional regulator